MTVSRSIGMTRGSAATGWHAAVRGRMKLVAAKLVFAVLVATPGAAEETTPTAAEKIVVVAGTVGVVDALRTSAAFADAGDRDMAIAVLRDKLAGFKDPADIAHLNHQLGQHHMDAGDWQAARDAYGTVVGLTEHLPTRMAQTAWNNLATATFQLGDYADVVRVVNEWHGGTVEPTPRSWQTLSLAHYVQGDYEPALEAGLAYVETVRRDGELGGCAVETALPSSRSGERTRTGRPAVRAANCQRARKGALVSAKFAGSLRFLRYAVSALEVPDTAAPEVADVLEQANEWIRAGTPQVASSALTDALAAPGLDEGDAALLREKLAWVYQLQGNHRRVQELFAEIVGAVAQGAELPAPIYHRTLLRYAGVSNLLGDHRRAVETLEEWRARVPSPSPAEQRRFLEAAAIAHLKLGLGEGGDLADEFLALLEETSEEVPDAFAKVWSAARCCGGSRGP